MIGWLTKRLSPAKGENSRWQQLAEALQETWDNQFSSLFEDTAKLISIWTSTPDGQRRKLAEYGERYEKDLDEKHLPVMLGMRKIEMLQKETALPAELMVLRMLGSNTENPIKPLYALTAAGYEQGKFHTSDEIADMAGLTEPPLLTSRVVIVVNIGDLQNPLTQAQITRLVDGFNYLKPLHIVYQGILYVIGFSVFVNAGSENSMTMRKSIVMRYSRNLALDGSWKLGSGNKIAERRISADVVISKI